MIPFALSLALSATPRTDLIAHAGVGMAVSQLATKGLCALSSEVRTSSRGLSDRHRPCRFGDLFFGAAAGVLAGLFGEQWDQSHGGDVDNDDAAATALGAVFGAAMVLEW